MPRPRGRPVSGLPWKYRINGMLVDKKTYNRMWADNLRQEVMKHYSPNLECAKCGFNDLRALSIDHINGGGLKHNREISGGRKGGYYLLVWLRAQGYPPGFQVLCMNCQAIKRHENRAREIGGWQGRRPAKSL